MILSQLKTVYCMNVCHDPCQVDNLIQVLINTHINQFRKINCRNHYILSFITGDWTVCNIMITITMTLLSISSFNLLGITVFRFISIKFPLSFKCHVTHNKALAATASVWICISIFSAAIFLRPKPPPGRNHITFPNARFL